MNGRKGAAKSSIEDAPIGGSRTWHGHANHILGSAAMLLLATGTVVYHLLEGWGWVDSFYFSSIAGTTVGFGDLVPTTDAAKLFTVAYVFLGLAIFGTFVNERLRIRQQHAVERLHG
jgi:hypothetical protein